MPTSCHQRMAEFSQSNKDPRPELIEAALQGADGAAGDFGSFLTGGIFDNSQRDHLPLVSRQPGQGGRDLVLADTPPGLRERLDQSVS